MEKNISTPGAVANFAITPGVLTLYVSSILEFFLGILLIHWFWGF